MPLNKETNQPTNQIILYFLYTKINIHTCPLISVFLFHFHQSNGFLCHTIARVNVLLDFGAEYN